ncbi:MAG: ABC transporter ATP-binding protein [Flavobacteriales bacterium]|nr:ABC transporter ATP-binding protein [Flavobacteriales bacterium]
MKTLLRYLKESKKWLLLALVLAAINQTFSLLDPLITGKMIDRLVTNRADFGDDWASFGKILTTYLLAAMGAAMISRIAKNFQDYYTSVVIQRTGAAMYTSGIKHSLELPYEEFEDQRSGETLGKIQKVRSDMEKLITTGIGLAFQSIVGIVFVMIVAVNIHWVIGPVFLLIVPLLTLLSNALSKRIKTVSKKILGETTTLAGSTTESLRNIELVKSLGLTSQEIERLNGSTNKILGLELKKVKYLRSLSFIQGTMVNFLRTCLIFFLYTLFFEASITFGEVWSLVIYSFFIFGPLQEIGTFIGAYREAEVSLKMFEEIMEKPVDYKAPNPKKISGLNSFSFNQVEFRHKAGNTYALKDISFSVSGGETIAFVGPSGSGKSTMVKLLTGLYRPNEGKILYGNIDSSEVDMNEIRERIGLVTQDTHLFAGTIRENLLFVRPGATEEQMLHALRQARCENLLERASNGIDTTIGEGGIKVSGGEKQRISIARALLRNPGLLIMDEATSALDSLTEEGITSTVRSLNETRTMMTVLIAHRLSTIMHADRIFVLEKGHIIEQGTHEELVLIKGLYFAMWRQQQGERHSTKEMAF